MLQPPIASRGGTSQHSPLDTEPEYRVQKLLKDTRQNKRAFILSDHTLTADKFNLRIPLVLPATDHATASDIASRGG